MAPPQNQLTLLGDPMHAALHDSSAATELSLKAGIKKRLAQVSLFLLAQAVILLAGAGHLLWMWAWIYLGICAASMMAIGFFLLRSSPETIAERSQARFAHRWDKIVSVLYGLFQFLLVPLVAALDIRFSWAGDLENTWQIAGALVLVAAFALSGWAVIVNAYFSTTVRIQADRGQTVCRSGPYRCIRHPGYVGFILQALSTPVVLGSVWGLLPGAAASFTLIIRTSMEDRMLRRELSGYEEYSRDVRFRLVPRVW